MALPPGGNDDIVEDPYPDVHTEDTNTEATQSHDQPPPNFNRASFFDDVVEMSKTAIKILDVDRLVQYGQT